MKLVSVEIDACELLRHLYLNRSEVDVQYVAYESGDRAMRSTVGEVATLARRGFVYGLLRQGHLVSVRLRVSIHAACRYLEDCKRGSCARPGSITAVRSKGLHFPRQVDIRHAKLGYVGGPIKALHFRDFAFDLIQ